MITTAAQILAEIGEEDEDDDRDVESKRNRGGRPVTASSVSQATDVILELRARRVFLGLSQRQVAERIGTVASSTISLWELGQCQPTLYNLICYAKALGGRVKLEFEG